MDAEKEKEAALEFRIVALLNYLCFYSNFS